MDAVPHPLVVELVQRLLKRRVRQYDFGQRKNLARQLIDPADEARRRAVVSAQNNAAGRATLTRAINAVLDKSRDTLSEDETNRLVQAAEGIDFPELVALAGYLGGTVNETPPGGEGSWRILYLDSQLQNWRLIPEEAILVFSRMDDDDAAFNKRDVIWVDSDALTARGDAPPRPEAQAKYLRGDFTRAGDLLEGRTGVGPGTDPQTGVFCPITPRCCTRSVRC
jgi:hypothetical protein